MRAHQRIGPAIVAVALATLTGCPAPGKGCKANRGYEHSEPVIGALERFRDDHGAYPEALADLVPTYITADALQPPVQESYGFAYRRVGESYELLFAYVGPGMNRCMYTPAAKWKCWGYF